MFILIFVFRKLIEEVITWPTKQGLSALFKSMVELSNERPIIGAHLDVCCKSVLIKNYELHKYYRHLCLFFYWRFFRII